MSPVILTPPPVPPPAEPGSTAPPTLTVTYYRQLASHFSETIDEIGDAIPRMANPLPKGFIRGHLNVPIKFLDTVISAVEQVTELQVIKKLDVERGRDTLQLIEAFRPIRDKVTGFLKDIDDALNSRQAELTVEALDTYALAKSLDRNPNSANLSAWVANMSRDLGKRGRRKPDPDETDTTPPTPATTMAAPEKPAGWNG